MASAIMVEIAPGELLDKITILELKLERISDAAKLANVRIEHETLNATRAETLPASDELDALVQDLKRVNGQLWEIEDDIRDCERQKDFSDTFIQLARAVYINNDERANLKRAINELLGSRLVEEKSYAAY